jgi:gamma-glutamyltranspeptidase/glutathione hydrolase
MTAETGPHHQRAAARHGAVAAGNADAVAAGIELLADGGNAVDALVATAFAMGVVEPLDCGLGAGGFAVVHGARDGQTRCLDFMSTAPAAARYQLFHTDTPGVGYRIAVRDRANEFGHRAVAVPGAVAGLCALHERHGQRDLAACLAPAIHLAREGFTLGRKPVVRLSRTLDCLRRFAPARELFLDDGEVPPEGSLRRNPDYAGALELIARDGASAFYTGELGGVLLEDMRRHDGFITAGDLAGYAAIWREPAAGAFAGHSVRTVGPPSSGALVLGGLATLENGDDGPAGLARAILSMFQARAEGLCDPAFPAPGAESAETTSLSTMDLAGNAASLTYSLNTHSGVVVPGTGMLLNNQMLLLDPWDNAPNSVAPGKRPASSMMPTLVFDDEGPMLAFGASGSSRILSALVQTLDRLLRRQQDLAGAIDAPRLHAELARLIADEELAEVARPLAHELDLELVLVPGRDSTMGSVQGVARRGELLEAAGDPRSGACGRVS